MNSFQISLDRYLTTPPEENDQWIELICEGLTEEFWNKHENGFLESDLFYNWCDKLERKSDGYDYNEEGSCIHLPGIKPEQAAKIIERTYNLFCK